MRTKPITYNDSRPAKPIGISAGIAGRIGARLLHEVREVLPGSLPTLTNSEFFLVSVFNQVINLVGAG